MYGQKACSHFSSVNDVTQMFLINNNTEGGGGIISSIVKPSQNQTHINTTTQWHRFSVPMPMHRIANRMENISRENQRKLRTVGDERKNYMFYVECALA